ncbi:hypothetical protein BN1723_020637, partial [Verticillium longisporum]
RRVHEQRDARHGKGHVRHGQEPRHHPHDGQPPQEPVEVPLAHSAVRRTGQLRLHQARPGAQAEAGGREGGA